MRNHHLNIALGAQSAALQQRLPEIDAPLIHVHACLHVVERVADAVEGGKELVVKQLLRVRPHLGIVRLAVEVGVHLRHLLPRSGALELLDVGRSEQKLPVEVAALDGVHVGDVDVAFLSRSHPHHRPVLEHLAANRPRPYQEVSQVFDPALKGLAKHRNLALIPPVSLVHALKLGGGEGLVGEALCGVKHEPLLDGHELARDCLHGLLGCDGTNHCHHRAKLSPRIVRQNLEKLLV
mmetsp:Transcript_3293/g.7894  ORF Transcript_3293/g.7894 Transcript_3293/m.7894 type:complete len:237 (-) Transcript_3293:1041-1751(-)